MADPSSKIKFFYIFIRNVPRIRIFKSIWLLLLNWTISYLEENLLKTNLKDSDAGINLGSCNIKTLF